MPEKHITVNGISYALLSVIGFKDGHYTALSLRARVCSFTILKVVISIYLCFFDFHFLNRDGSYLMISEQIMLI